MGTRSAVDGIGIRNDTDTASAADMFGSAADRIGIRNDTSTPAVISSIWSEQFGEDGCDRG